MSRKHTFDQHFLRSPRLALELIGHSNVRKNDTVYDLGAGSGVISAALAKRAKRVVAVEREPDALHKLRSNLSAEQGVTIVDADILTMPLPAEPYKIVANIPFSLSAQVVKRYAQPSGALSVMYLIVQKQFAQKLQFGNHFTSMLGVQIAPWWSVRVRRPLRRTDFTPPPRVDTVFIEIKRRPEPYLPVASQQDWYDFITRCFQNQSYFADIEVPMIAERRKKPSELTLDEWLFVYRRTVDLHR